MLACVVLFLIWPLTIKCCAGKVLSPSRKRIAVDHVMDELGVSQRQACRAISQHRPMQRRPRAPRSDETALTQAIIALAECFGCYGYRRITALLREAGWHVSAGRVFGYDLNIKAMSGLMISSKTTPMRAKSFECFVLLMNMPANVWLFMSSANSIAVMCRMYWAAICHPWSTQTYSFR